MPVAQERLTRKQIPFSPMTVAGIMSGTSADGVDVAFVRITPHKDALKLRLLAHSAFPFSRPLRNAVLGAMDAKSISTAELARLNWRLGQAYAETARAALDAHPCRLQLIGCHGQTVYHQATAAMYAERKVACTWQIGEPALLAAEMHVPIVSNFRPADMVAGGQGAPLVPLLDYVLFAHKKRARVLQNIGGIGNLTLVPANASPEHVIAFDTGPGNMVIDSLMQKLFNKRFDKDGRIAKKGSVLHEVVRNALKQSFFKKLPPKSAGREEFGAAFSESFLRTCRETGGKPEDAIATATYLTTESIANAFEKFIKPRLNADEEVDYIVSGGGAKNSTLMTLLTERLAPLGCNVVGSGAQGLPPEAKEAVAFALLAYYTWHRHPANVPSATGASRPAILGQITYA